MGFLCRKSRKYSFKKASKTDVEGSKPENADDKRESFPEERLKGGGGGVCWEWGGMGLKVK